MNLLPERRTLRVVALVAAAAYVLHGVYFDWSDRFVHVLLAVAFLAASWWWPRAAAGCLVLLLAITVFAHHVLWTPPRWTAAAEPGGRWADAREALGSPTYEARNLADASRALDGWAAPSPLRFGRTGPVVVFVRGENALWVLHDGERVITTFVGGT